MHVFTRLIEWKVIIRRCPGVDVIALQWTEMRLIVNEHDGVENAFLWFSERRKVDSEEIIVGNRFAMFVSNDCFGENDNWTS